MCGFIFFSEKPKMMWTGRKTSIFVEKRGVFSIRIVIDNRLNYNYYVLVYQNMLKNVLLRN